MAIQHSDSRTTGSGRRKTKKLVCEVQGLFDTLRSTVPSRRSSESVLESERIQATFVDVTAYDDHQLMPKATLLLTVCLLPHAPSSHAQTKRAFHAYLLRESNFTESMTKQMQTLSHGARVAVLDVGANDGTWSAQMLERLLPLAQSSQLHLTMEMYEPQPWFGPNLRKVTAAAKERGNGMAEAIWTEAAAWTHEGNLSFYVQRGLNKLQHSKTATLIKSHAMQHEDKQRITVRAVDLAERLPRDAQVLLVKIDVEGAEYALLRALLARGALCCVTHLHIEWHRFSEPESERNASRTGTSLRQTLEQRLRTRCAQRRADAKLEGGRAAWRGGGWVSPSPRVLHEDFPPFEDSFLAPMPLLGSR
jgi:FkbM family methyltransferase